MRQVDFCWTPRPLEHDDVVFGQQGAQRSSYNWPDAWCSFRPWKRADSWIRLAQDDDLTTRHPLRLYENRIHSDVRYRASRQRLQVLRDADLAALYDASVVRHVLCLERRHPDALPGEMAAESRCDETFSCPARRSLHHQCTRISHRAVRLCRRFR